MSTFDRRSWLMQRFDELYVGYFDEIVDMNLDDLESMVEELESAQADDELDLETIEGCDNLERIVNKYL